MCRAEDHPQCQEEEWITARCTLYNEKAQGILESKSQIGTL